MSKSKEQKGVIDNIGNLKKEIAILRQSLNAAGSQKEGILKEKDSLKDQIGALILQVSEARKKRNQLTAEVKKAKELRNNINKKIKEAVQDIHSFNDKVKGMINDKERLLSPEDIDKSISRIEENIETQVLPFEKEKELMKKIKELKKQKESSKKIFEVLKNLKEKKREANSLRKESQETHLEIQVKAKQSQEQHERLISLSKEIESLMDRKDKLYIAFNETRKKISELSTQLKEKIAELSTLDTKSRKYRKERKEKAEKEKEDMLKSIKEKAEEKFKRKEKLTTKDILAMQSLDDIKEGNNKEK